MNSSAVVLFDLGKVLVDFDWAIVAGRIAPHSRFSADQLLDGLRTSPLLPAYELGRLSSREFFEQVRDLIAYRGSINEFAAQFGDMFSEIPEMTALHARVRAAGFSTYIFSNTNDFAIRFVREHFPFFANFDGYFLSYELGVMKPESGIYERAEQVTGRTGESILYVDDHGPNVDAAKARGWRTVLHVTPADTKAQVERVLGL